MARAPRNDEAANHTIAIRATQGEKDALDRILARAAPGLSPDASRSDRFRRLILDLDGGEVVPLTDGDRAILARLVEGRTAELARLGVHEARVTPASMFVHLLRSAGASAVASSAPPVAVPLPAQSVLPFAAPPVVVVAEQNAAAVPPVAEHEHEHEAALAPVEPVKAPVAPVEPVVVHEAPLAPVEPVKAPVAPVEPVVVHEAPLAPVEPVVVHEAPLALAHEKMLATVRAAANKALDEGRTQSELRKAVAELEGVEINTGTMSRFIKQNGPMAAEKLAALAKVLGL
jgi:hypothetical protein